MRLVFLEIESVLMIPACHMVARLLQQELTAFKPSVDALNFITKETNAKLVITSSWISMGIGVLQNKLNKWGVNAEIVDVLPTAGSKENGIKRWFELWKESYTYENGLGPIDGFVIIDNEHVSSLYEKWLVRTNMDDGGLTQQLAFKAIEILRRPNDFEGAELYRRRQSVQHWG